MYYCPYYNPDLYREDSTNSYVRVLHASPNAPPVDIYVNNNPVIKNLRFKEFSDYLSLKGGIYNIKVFPAKNNTNLILNKNITVPPKSILTVAAAGNLKDLELLPFIEPKIPIMRNKSMIRFAHLSPDAPAVDITLPDGTILFKNISFKNVSDYISVDPKKYTLQARIANTDKIVLTVPNIILRPNRFYTAYAVGLAMGNPPLELLLPLDGNTYLKV